MKVATGDVIKKKMRRGSWQPTEQPTFPEHRSLWMFCGVTCDIPFSIVGYHVELCCDAMLCDIIRPQSNATQRSDQ